MEHALKKIRSGQQITAEGRTEAFEELQVRCKEQGRRAVWTLLGISRGHLNDILHGRRELSDTMVEKLAATAEPGGGE